jgi:hypothetical protein
VLQTFQINEKCCSKVRQLGVGGSRGELGMSQWREWKQQYCGGSLECPSRPQLQVEDEVDEQAMKVSYASSLQDLKIDS